MMDARRKKVLTVLSIGSLILVWRIYALFEKYGPATAAAVEAPAAAATPEVTPTSDSPSKSALGYRLGELLARQSEVGTQEWGRNPFAAIPWVARMKSPEQAIEVKTQDAPPPPQIRFTGVSRSGDQWLAAVNGDILRIGAVIEKDYRLLRITRHSMTLESRGWTFTYNLGEPSAVIDRVQEEPK